MQTTQVDNHRAGWKLHDNAPHVLLVQDGTETIGRWSDGITVEQARVEYPDLAPLWTQVREAGRKQHLAESAGARGHADFFHQPY